MRRGRVYLWTPDPNAVLGGSIRATVVPLPHLDAEGSEGVRLHGQHVRVCNGGAMNEPDVAGRVRVVPIGDAVPDADGDFLFEPGRGGGRIDKVLVAEPDVRERYVQASHFGEVNTYYHLDAVAAYVHELLSELGAPGLPRVTAVVNAHHAAVERGGVRDGVPHRGRWRPFQGGHYRLPARRYDIPEYDPLALRGEIHLGPGRKLLDHGALVEAAGGRYRANASHNAGILYHEYGHHVCCHTADLRANELRSPDDQDNRKTALEEGTCDYWTAATLGTPHIWAWHRRHDADVIHPRSLTSAKTMADFDPSSGADPHANGTIWGAALWDLRTRLGGTRRADLLVLKALLVLGELTRSGGTTARVRRASESYATGLGALLRADELLHAGRDGRTVLDVFAARGIRPDAPKPAPIASPRDTVFATRVPPDEIPKDNELFAAGTLDEYLAALGEPPFSVVAVGDIMLGGRARSVVAERGDAYTFDAVSPLLRRGTVVLGNLEGPFARHARKEPRNHSYRVDPRLAAALARANIGVVTLANNHLLDCGRAGVVETLDALAHAGVAPLGAGLNETAAHVPVVRQAGRLQIGFLGYYWNRRCAATANLPGSAVDSPDALAADIRELRRRVDRVVVAFHWGVPYVREPSTDDRAKARFAIDCGADAVIGHHSHVVQPFEVYRGRPVFFSVGNFVMGSGNSGAEGLLLGLHFDEGRTTVRVFPLYVKNRDPRVNYQPKVLRGGAADWVLGRLAAMSGASGAYLTREKEWGRLDLRDAAASHS